MLLNLPSLVREYGLHINGVIHVGAHLAEEAPIYRDLGINNVNWIEANPENVDKVLKIVADGGYPHRVIEALITDVPGGERTFHVTNIESMSSSIFDFGTHPTFSPEIVFEQHLNLPTTTLDTLAGIFNFGNANFLNMDIQGAELLALKGADDLLTNSIDYVMTEVNREEVYVGCAKVWELERVLSEYGFVNMEIQWVEGQGWGDGFWMKHDA